jgi:hypothetical protein
MEVPDILVRNSNLTLAQIESLTGYLQVLSHEKTLREAASIRPLGPVKIGSFYRAVQQGKKNIKSSILTLVIAIWMGFVKADDLRRLLNQVSNGLPELGDEEKNHLTALIEALTAEIVM